MKKLIWWIIFNFNSHPNYLIKENPYIITIKPLHLNHYHESSKTYLNQAPNLHKSHSKGKFMTYTIYLEVRLNSNKQLLRFIVAIHRGGDTAVMKAAYLGLALIWDTMPQDG